MTSDEQLTADIVEELRSAPTLRRSRIYVRALDGTVTVSGQVGTFAERCSIDGAVARVSGLKALDMQVSISRFAARGDS